MLRFSAVPLEGVDSWNGRLLMFEAPRDGFNYALGVDVAEGVGKDRSVVQVLRLGTLYEPDEQVAEFASDWHTTQQLVALIETIGTFYRGDDGLSALAVIEVTGPGLDVCSDLQGKGYDNVYERRVYDKADDTYLNKIGWSTNRTSRQRLLQRSIHAFSLQDLVINSPHLFDEMQDFTTDQLKAKAQAKAGRHDDRVMALMIGYVGGHDEEWLSGDDIATDRRLLRKKNQPILTAAGKLVRKDWQNMPITAAEMRAAWNE